MKTYTYATIAPVSAERLYHTITDIAHWPEWDHDIEATAHDGRLARGVRFMLKPKGGPKVAMEIIKAVAPTLFVDLSYLPLAKMRTSHRFTPQPNGSTQIDLTIDVFGPLAFLWDRLLARKQATGAAQQTRALIAYAGRAAYANA